MVASSLPAGSSTFPRGVAVSGRLAIALLVAWFAFLLPSGQAAAQTFPELTGRVVDQADLLTAAQEAELTARLAQLEQASSRQLVVATVSSLEGQVIEDYGYRLGRHWGIGQSEADNGVILLVAPNEKKVRIEVGYGLEGILTDALASQIINSLILPRFRQGDFPGGIMAATDAIIAQLQAPPELAEQRALEAARSETRGSSDTGSWFPLIFWILVMIFVFLPLFGRGTSGLRRYGRRRSGLPIVVWGPGARGRSSGTRGGWGGFSGGGGGFSGGGGSFGGGGASGGW